MPSAKSSRSTQRDRVAARGGVERDAGAGDAAADHDDVEASSCDASRASLREIIAGASVEELHDLVGGARSGGALLLDRAAEVDQADEALARPGCPTRGAALGVRSTSGVRQ